MAPNAIVAGRNKWCADLKNGAEDEGEWTVEEDMEGEVIRLKLTGLVRLEAKLEEIVARDWVIGTVSVTWRKAKIKKKAGKWQCKKNVIDRKEFKKDTYRLDK